MKVTLGKLNVDIPGPVDAAAAERAALEVSRRLLEAESKSTRIDTLAFALSTAHSLAMELEKTKMEREEDAAEMAKALRRIADTLKDFVNNLTPAAP